MLPLLLAAAIPATPAHLRLGTGADRRSFGSEMR